MAHWDRSVFRYLQTRAGASILQSTSMLQKTKMVVSRHSSALMNQGMQLVLLHFSFVQGDIKLNVLGASDPLRQAMCSSQYMEVLFQC